MSALSLVELGVLKQSRSNGIHIHVELGQKLLVACEVRESDVQQLHKRCSQVVALSSSLELVALFLGDGLLDARLGSPSLQFLNKWLLQVGGRLVILGQVLNN